MISGPSCLIYLFLPLPAFLFGLVLHGLAGRLAYLAFGVIAFAIGYGLYRLHNSARVAVFALLPVSLLQILVLLTPWGARQFHNYMNEVMSLTTGGSVVGQPTVFASIPAMLLSSLAGIIGYGVVLWLLHRHRAAFTAAPPPPPAPPIPDLPQPAVG